MAEVLSSNLSEPITFHAFIREQSIPPGASGPAVPGTVHGTACPGPTPVWHPNTLVCPDRQLVIYIDGTIKPHEVREMPTYTILMKLTDKGSQEIKAAPERIEKAIADFEGMGGKLIAFYALLGKYDYIAIGDAPSDAVATTFLLGLNSHGFVRTMSFRAFSVEDFTGMVSELP
jgi:uncharacterized protein with GYD domain